MASTPRDESEHFDQYGVGRYDLSLAEGTPGRQRGGV